MFLYYKISIFLKKYLKYYFWIILRITVVRLEVSRGTFCIYSCGEKKKRNRVSHKSNNNQYPHQISFTKLPHNNLLMKNCHKTISRAFITLATGWYRKHYCKNIVKQKDLMPKNYHLLIGSTEDVFQTS
jgi:hypothetical protein